MNAIQGVHSGPVRSLAMAPGGDVVFVGGDAGIITLQPMPNLTLAATAVTGGVAGAVESLVNSTYHTASSAASMARSSAVERLGSAKGTASDVMRGVAAEALDGAKATVSKVLGWF